MASKNDAVELDKTNHKKRPDILEGVGPVVSSAHLANSAVPAMSEMEFGLTMSNHAFHRWMVRCMAAAGEPGLSPMEVLVLHLVNSRERPKSLADICLVLNIEDTHVVNYAIKKLAKQKLIETGKAGKEKTVAVSQKGAQLCARYAQLREALFIQAVKQMGFDPSELSRLAALLRTLSGNYDQASRAAASM